MHSKRVSLLVLFLFCTASVAVRADKVDDHIKPEMQNQHIPGLSLAVLKNGKIIKAAGCDSHQWR